MSLYDFYMYLKHIEFSAENLEFYMWYVCCPHSPLPSFTLSSKKESMNIDVFGNNIMIGTRTTKQATPKEVTASSTTRNTAPSPAVQRAPPLSPPSRTSLPTRSLSTRRSPRTRSNASPSSSPSTPSAQPRTRPAHLFLLLLPQDKNLLWPTSSSSSNNNSNKNS